jgi:hypothetical protein
MVGAPLPPWPQTSVRCRPGETESRQAVPADGIRRERLFVPCVDPEADGDATLFDGGPDLLEHRHFGRVRLWREKVSARQDDEVDASSYLQGSVKQVF